MDAKMLGRRLREHGMDIESYRKNIILTQNVFVSMDSECDNINTMIIGGAGRLKSRGFIIPNIMQMNCNPVVTDPKGGALRSVVKSYGTAQV